MKATCLKCFMGKGHMSVRGFEVVCMCAIDCMFLSSKYFPACFRQRAPAARDVKQPLFGALG